MWMTWDMLREMKAGGMWLGGHTVNHPVLARLDRDRQAQEISGCAKRLREELGEPMRWFSYPVGGPDAFNDDTRECLRDAGVETAFSYYGGYRRFDDWDRYDVRRVAVDADVADTRFRAMLALPQAFARPLKRRASSLTRLRPSL
jgi:peptidoglycan/xylan/chitin deacetylase (PgdA/CDA1 family)